MLGVPKLHEYLGLNGLALRLDSHDLGLDVICISMGLNDPDARTEWPLSCQLPLVWPGLKKEYVIE